MTTQEYIEAHKSDDVRRLALSAHPDGVDMQYALTQISGWQAARTKVPLWAATEGIIYPRHLSLEQCTSQYVAQFKATFIKDLLGEGFAMADLTGGMGVDCFFISQYADKAYYYDIQPDLCELARHNFAVLGRDIRVCTTGTVPVAQGLSLLYIDPARRDSAGRKLVSIRDCQPDVVEMQEDLKRQARYVMVKLSPMLDMTRALTELKHVSHVFIIGLEGECKEITLLMQRGFEAEPTITAVDIKADGTPESAVSSAKSTDNALPLPIANPEQLQPGTYISEPSAPYMKSALFRTIAAQTDTTLLHPDTHLFWSKEKPEKFPGRTFQISGIIPFDKRSLSALTKTQANLSVRNFPESAPQLQSRLKLRDGGPRYLIATTLADSRRVLLDLRKS
ncbi:MAG: SAM-dependent methyltransferase [Bacteroidaceae bacterium]|nr:SAM-dependent methyltransferase [Bacteroidaceae bacterium]